MERTGRVPTLFAIEGITADWLITNGGEPARLGVVAKLAYVRRGERIDLVATPGLATADKTPVPAPADAQLPALRVFARIAAPGYERIVELTPSAPCFDKAARHETIVFGAFVPAEGILLGEAIVVVGLAANGGAVAWPAGEALRQARPHVFANRRVRTGPVTPVDCVSSELPFVRPNPLLHREEQRRSPPPPSSCGLPFVAAPANDVAVPLPIERSGDAIPTVADAPFELVTLSSRLRPSRHDMTVVVKASCDLVADGPAVVRAEPEPISGDVYEDDEPAARLLFAGDLAPLKPSCDVLVYAPDAGSAAFDSILRVRGSEDAIDAKARRAADLGPVSPNHPSRASLLGTYDAAWFATRWPCFAADLDPRAFQSARPGQRLAVAVGDESYEILGASVERPRLRGTLPGVRPLVAARLRDGTWCFVPVRLDTIAFVVHDLRVDLVWRGLLEVSDDDAPEIALLFVTCAPARGGAPTVEEIEARFLRATQEEDDEIAPAIPALDEDDHDGESDDATDIEDAPTQDEAGEPDATNAELPPPDPEQIAAAMREAGADEEQVADVLRGLRRQTDDEEPEPPSIPRAAVTEDARAEVMRRLEATESLAGLDLSHADLSGLDLSGQDLSGADLTGAHLTGSVLRGACLDDADLAAAILDGADLRLARAERASFHRADLRAARLEGADLEAADLTGAKLEAAVLDGAVLSDVRFYDADATRASFRRAVMRGARAEGAVAVEACFAEAWLDESVWEGATLTKASFESTSLRSASLVRARCDGASFVRSDLSEARLARASLVRAAMMKANLFEANADRADLREADLRGSSLHGVSAAGTKLAGARLDGAITSYSLLGSRAS